MNILDNVTLNHNDRASLNYAKAKQAIETAWVEQCKELSAVGKYNAALAKTKERRLFTWAVDAKSAVIELLQGKVEPCKRYGKKVVFNDGTQARY